MTSPSLGLTPQDISITLAYIDRYAPGAEVWAFGSRVRGTSRPFSDLDLAIIQEKKLDAQSRAELNYALSESNLPVKVDIIEWSTTSEPFRDLIRQNYIVLRPKST